jgi:hypothetical protein
MGPWKGLAELTARAEPWIALVEHTLDRIIGGSPLAKLLPPPELAYASITFNLGVNMFTRLDADRSRTESLFIQARRAGRSRRQAAHRTAAAPPRVTGRRWPERERPRVGALLEVKPLFEIQ